MPNLSEQQRASEALAIETALEELRRDLRRGDGCALAHVEPRHRGRAPDHALPGRAGAQPGFSAAPGPDGRRRGHDALALPPRAHGEPHARREGRHRRLVGPRLSAARRPSGTASSRISSASRPISSRAPPCRLCPRPSPAAWASSTPRSEKVLDLARYFSRFIGSRAGSGSISPRTAIITGPTSRSKRRRAAWEDAARLRGREMGLRSSANSFRPCRRASRASWACPIRRRIAIAPNTHEFLRRLLSSLPVERAAANPDHGRRVSLRWRGRSRGWRRTASSRSSASRSNRWRRCPSASGRRRRAAATISSM